MAITRKVSPSEPLVPMGDPFFCGRFSKKGKWRASIAQAASSFLGTITRKSPRQRDFSSLGIVPTGELEGRQDRTNSLMIGVGIVPTGELEGRQDYLRKLNDKKCIVPTGELEGRQDEAARLKRDGLIVPTGELEGRQDC